jgi:hypothetical protein
MTKDTKEIDLDEIPNLAFIKNQIAARAADVVIVKAGRDKTFDTYTLRLKRGGPGYSDLCVPENVLSDLNGRNKDHRVAQLKQLIQDAIGPLSSSS